MNPIDTHSAWQQMIDMMRETSHDPGDEKPSPKPPAKPIRNGDGTRRYSQEDLNIRVLERMTDHTITVSWGHSCAGHFGLQTWREAKSRKSGVCALSGDSIAPGDKIYKLFRPSTATYGRNECLLACHVEVILAGGSLQPSLQCELLEAEQETV